MLNTLWMGPALGRVERACLRSAMRAGHPVRLYCYDPPAGVPEGIEIADASRVVSADRIVHHASGSVSLFSNLFRYVLQREGLGTWIDADVYLLAPIDGMRPMLLGRQAPDRLNGAVLRLPSDSPLLPLLIALFDEVEVPFWLGAVDQLAAMRRLRDTGRTGLAHMPWGSAGPNALTALARRLGLMGEAMTAEVFYPAPHEDAGWIRDPDRRLSDIATPNTVAVHLWNERIKTFKDQAAPEGSFLARLQAEGE